MLGDLLDSIWQIFMTVGIAGIFGITIETLPGISLVVSAKSGLYGSDLSNNILGKIVSTIRSILFMILIALMISFIRPLVGASIGVRGVIVSMIAGIISLVTRMTERALLEVDPGAMKAARSVGVSRPYITVHILLRENLPGLLRSLVTSLISLIGLSAMTGSVSGDGIDNFTIRYGYSRYMNDITVVIVLLPLLIVNIVQSVGNRTAQWPTY